MASPLVAFKEVSLVALVVIPFLASPVNPLPNPISTNQGLNPISTPPNLASPLHLDLLVDPISVDQAILVVVDPISVDHQLPISVDQAILVVVAFQAPFQANLLVNPLSPNLNPY